LKWVEVGKYGLTHEKNRALVYYSLWLEEITQLRAKKWRIAMQFLFLFLLHNVQVFPILSLCHPH